MPTSTLLKRAELAAPMPGDARGGDLRAIVRCLRVAVVAGFCCCAPISICVASAEALEVHIWPLPSIQLGHGGSGGEDGSGGEHGPGAEHGHGNASGHEGSHGGEGGSNGESGQGNQSGHGHGNGHGSSDEPGGQQGQEEQQGQAPGTVQVGIGVGGAPQGHATETNTPHPSSRPAASVAAPTAPTGAGGPTTQPASSASSAAAGATRTPVAPTRDAASHAIGGRAFRRLHKGAGRRAGADGGVVASSPASTALPTTAAAKPARDVFASHTRRAVHRHPAPSRLPPLVTTITKVVDVVPLPVRALIASLLALAFALAVRSRLAARRTRRLARERGKLLEDVGLLQAALLPVPPARLGPVVTSAAYRPADGPAAGGDFYDVFALESGQIAVILGDISGHGRQALPHTALVRFTLRAYLEAGLAPREAIQTAGAVLERQLGESLATVVVATYQPRERRLTYACAGHPQPVVLGSQPLSPVTACSALPIGTGRRTGTRQTTVSLPGAARVCFYTDGLTEARVGPQLFGVERLQDSLAALGPDASASALMDSVAKQTDARPDDMAACLLSITGDAQEPSVLMEELELSGEELCGDRPQRFLLACGIERHRIDELLGGVRASTKRGTYVLQAGHAGESQQLTLRPSAVTALHAGQAQQRALAGASR